MKEVTIMPQPYANMQVGELSSLVYLVSSLAMFESRRPLPPLHPVEEIDVWHYDCLPLFEVVLAFRLFTSLRGSFCP